MHEHSAIVEENGNGMFGVWVRIGPHSFVADEPRDLGGLGAGPDPYEFLLAGLGACTVMTIRLHANREGWPLEHVEVHVRHMLRQPSGDALKDVFERQIRMDGELSQEERARLFDGAERCPVALTLSAGSILRSTLTESDNVGEATS